MRKKRRARSTSPDIEQERPTVERKTSDYYSSLTSEELKEQTLWGSFAHDEAREIAAKVRIAAGCPPA